MAARGPVRSDRELSIALGCVVYDALLLALSIQMRQSRYKRSKITGLTWTEAQIGLELILLKARVLDDFLISTSRKKDDMLASDFRYTPSPEFRALSEEFRTAINKRSAHLTWARVKESLPEFDEIGDGIDVYADRVLDEIRHFIRTRIEAGIEPVTDRHVAYVNTFKRVYDELRPKPTESPRAGGA